MNCLICIFSGASNDILRELDESPQNYNPRKKTAAKILADGWEKKLEGIENAEKALFLPGLMHSGDEFTDRYRRFVQVGANKEDRVQNVFELAFEKGYDRAIFVEDFSAFCESNVFPQAVKELESKDMIFAPKPNGSVFLWGLNVNAYNTILSFNTEQAEFVVDLISHCNEHQLAYSLLPGTDPNAALKNLDFTFRNQ